MCSFGKKEEKWNDIVIIANIREYDAICENARNSRKYRRTFRWVHYFLSKLFDNLSMLFALFGLGVLDAHVLGVVFTVDLEVKVEHAFRFLEPLQSNVCLVLIMRLNCLFVVKLRDLQIHLHS